LKIYIYNKINFLLFENWRRGEMENNKKVLKERIMELEGYIFDYGEIEERGVVRLFNVLRERGKIVKVTKGKLADARKKMGLEKGTTLFKFVKEDREERKLRKLIEKRKRFLNSCYLEGWDRVNSFVEASLSEQEKIKEKKFKLEEDDDYGWKTGPDAIMMITRRKRR